MSKKTLKQLKKYILYYGLLYVFVDMDREYNLAFIDGQNLYTWVKKDGRKIDFTRFRVYLKERLWVNEAFYYI